MKEVVTDLWILCRDYAKQETIDPVKMLGRFLGWGLAGSLALCLGIGFGALAIIRGLQTETGAHLTSSLNWVPYLVGLIFTGLAAAISIWFIKRPFRHEEASA
ncbi:hypothetical protein [Aquihabitans sp. McL0605]|uniref:hypothetical protein n=1 Tax=Aquihabitans sp. McL0605 TaxID=3415671 RepID=UPI003CF3F6BE